MKDERIVEILMDDDEIEVIQEMDKRTEFREKKEKDVTTRVPYGDAVIEVGHNIKVRIVDAAIAIVGLILAYLIFSEVF